MDLIVVMARRGKLGGDGEDIVKVLELGCHQVCVLHRAYRGQGAVCGHLAPFDAVIIELATHASVGEVK
jgi:hypothetical protein